MAAVAAEEFAALGRYDKNWLIEEIMKSYLKNTSYQHRKRANIRAGATRDQSSVVEEHSPNSPPCRPHQPRVHIPTRQTAYNKKGTRKDMSAQRVQDNRICQDTSITDPQPPPRRTRKQKQVYIY